MPFVVDASVSIEWLMPDESSDLAEHALERLDGDEAFVPGLWWFEVRIALLSAERRTRLTRDQTVGGSSPPERAKLVNIFRYLERSRQALPMGSRNVSAQCPQLAIE